MLAYRADAIITTLMNTLERKVFGENFILNPNGWLRFVFTKCPHALALDHKSTNDYVSTHSFGDTFEPRTFSAQNHSTSELLRTL